MCENPSKPRTASGLRKGGSNTTSPRNPSVPLCRGTPNLLEKSVRTRAIVCIPVLIPSALQFKSPSEFVIARVHAHKHIVIRLPGPLHAG